ncbi:MAG: hypothetical protein LQ345_005951 [Seirophora villosa]|nr:MAG: hypothetical protein LQ345_005951 [Seirophora villosa]
MSQPRHKERVSSNNDLRIGPVTGRALLKPRRDPDAQWTAEVKRVQRCDSTSYNGGRGFETQFEYSREAPNAQRRCFLVGHGGLEGLTLLLKINAVYQDLNPTVLHRFFIPTDNALISLRLFDKGMVMEIHIDPERVGRRRSVGDYWAIVFRAHTTHERDNARAMMRKIEALTREMPDGFFKYRNFFTKVGLAADGTRRSPPREPTEGYYEHELSSGHKMVFTGYFATAAFQRALGHDIVRPARPVSMDPEEGQNVVDQPRLLRSMIRPTTSNAYLFSCLAPSGSVAVNVIKGGRRDKALSKRETRRANRDKKRVTRRASRALQARKAMEPESDSGDSDRLQSSQETPPFYFGPLEISSPQRTTGAQIGAAEQSRRATSSVAADDSSRPVSGGTPDVDDGDADASEDFPIKGVLNERKKKGKTEYLVDWEPDSDGEEYHPSWLPETNLSAEELQEWNAKKPKKRAASTRGRGAARKRGRK